VSTAQIKAEPKADSERGGPGAFETCDFYLACFLRCAGYELIDLRGERRRRAFIFKAAELAELLENKADRRLHPLVGVDLDPVVPAPAEPLGIASDRR
jgi:hypothetical protein